MWKTLLAYASMFDAVMVPLCILLGLANLFLNTGEDHATHAVFWVLLALWFGRDQGRNG